MAARTVTIFGGSGFIGRYVVRQLAREGWVIRVAVRDPKGAQFLKPLGTVGQIVPLATRLQDEASVVRAVEGVDAVINLVGILYESGRQSFDAVHHQGAKRIAEAARAAGVAQLVHISAIGASTKAASDYARSKGAGEQAVKKAFKEAAILRPSIVFGPEDDFFNRFAAMARISPALPLIGGGETKFQPVYVTDVANAVSACLAQPAAKGATFELGGPKVYSFKELMRLLLQAIARRRLLLPLPFPLARLQASVLELVTLLPLPIAPLLTRDQVTLLESDNVVSKNAKGLADLGVEAHSVEVILPTYLERYRPGGRFTAPPVEDARKRGT
ncbi:MAG: complex I NDUFA9 subunit family protein [Rhodovibrionaceae bacterium]